MKNREGVLRFISVDIWQRGFDFGVSVIQMTRTLSKEIEVREIVRQIIRSSTSIAANLAEGSGGSTKKEFTRYVDIARKSALETYNWLLLIEKMYRVQHIAKIKKECEEIVKILSTIVLRSRQKK